MSRFAFVSIVIALTAAGVAAWLLRTPDELPRSFEGVTGDAERGAYVARLAGCIACHTDTVGGRKFLAGGPPIKTPFGTFRAPNITPDPADGIGNWTLAGFSSALTQGKSPTGARYYPVFPYTSYTRMTDQDIADLWAALVMVPPVEGEDVEQDIHFPFNFRLALRAWQKLFFDPGSFESDSNRDQLWNRGAYIVSGPGHCVACHSPRNLLGATDRRRHLEGSTGGPGGEKVPSIRGSALRLEGWSESDIEWALRMGLKPDGDSLSGSMGEVVRHGTSWLTDEDRKAIAAYLASLD